MSETPKRFPKAGRRCVFHRLDTSTRRVRQIFAFGRTALRVAQAARYDHITQVGDVVADRRDDGSDIIRRWRASDGELLPIAGHDEFYGEEETYRRLDLLRGTGMITGAPTVFDV
jgi:hypothetical protein